MAPSGTRLCFVIMPFSGTPSCTEEEWTRIFEQIIKPAIEGAGLGYQCKRSEATRGNIVAAIMESLRDAYVVIADLTDRNANVFYELGVRHALRNRTILLAQDRQFIPFDLLPYANHIYEWKTEAGVTTLNAKIKVLLEEIDQSPDRNDNPVTDFLRGEAEVPKRAVPEAVVTPSEAANAQTLAGPQSEGLNPIVLSRRLADAGDTRSARLIARLTRNFFQSTWPGKVADLNKQGMANRQVTENDILEYVLPIVRQFSSDILRFEGYGLGLIESEFSDGLIPLLRILEDWLTLSSKIWPGQSWKPIIGSPGLMAVRSLNTWGAKTCHELLFEGLPTLLTHPLVVTGWNDETTRVTLTDRPDLLHSDALLGYGTVTLQYLASEPWENPWTREVFPSLRDYELGLAQFLFLTCFIHQARHPDAQWPLYPAFKLIEKSQQAVQAILARIFADNAVLRLFADMCRESEADFRVNFTPRVRAVKSAQTGRQMLDRFGGWDDLPETYE